MYKIIRPRFQPCPELQAMEIDGSSIQPFEAHRSNTDRIDPLGHFRSAWGCQTGCTLPSSAATGREGRAVLVILSLYGGFLKSGYPSSWMVYFMENPIEMDDEQG